MNFTDETVLLGAGPMAIAYTKVLQGLNQPFFVVGRGEKSAEEFKKETGIMPFVGGYEAWLRSQPKTPKRAIVAVSESYLGQATLSLLEIGIPNILVEKPGGFIPSEIKKIAELSKKRKIETYVGYNRRFYASTQTAKKLIEEDGGVSSFHFEFTEWGHVIEKKICPQPVKDEWFLHNSTHVVDLAFYLGGSPKEMQSYMAGSLTWHQRASKYSGAGVTDGGALFSYHANWGAPGRWNLEVLTPKNRYIFRPVEKLQVQKIGTVAVEEVSIDDDLDKKFKPGLFKQTEAFFANDTKILPTVEDQVRNLEIYKKIENFNS